MRASILIAFLIIFSQANGQNRKNDLVSGHFENLPLEVIFDSLSSQTNYFFSYNSAILPKGSLYTITGGNIPIDQFLSKLLEGTGLKYSFYKDQIILNYEVVEDRIVKKRNFFAISGTVYDENGKTLSNVNIFLDGTTIGVYSDIDGNYKLESIPPGFYNIVFSHVGYKNKVYQISETKGKARIQTHQMEADLQQLDEVEVISNRIKKSESGWEQHYELFCKEVLGQSQNAQQAVIENPESLDFTYYPHNKTLNAYSKLPLQIRNDALGYRVSYFLESFQLEESDLRFRGKIRFRNLQPLKPSDKREWKKNRKTSYLGSFNHFKRALLTGDLKKEGFKIYEVKSLDNFEMKNENELEAADIVVFKGDHYELDFKNYLAIEYRREKESEDYLSNSPFVQTLYADFLTDDGTLIKGPGNQISAIKLLRNSVRLDLSGEVMDRFGLTTFGYWAWERTADLVPINYNPKYDNL